MPVRTQSSFARAIVSSGRIEKSEQKRLQDAILTIESSVGDYGKEVERAEHRRTNWGYFTKVGKAFTTIGSILGATGVGATVGAPLATIGAVMTAGGSAMQTLEAKGMYDEAEKIETEAAKRLEGLLFVGDESKKVSKGATEFKGGEVERTDQYWKDLAVAGVKDTAVAFVQAGQAGSFEKYLPGMQETLNAPLMQGFEVPEDAGTVTKLGYEYMQSKAPSIGSLLGGATPYEQEVYGGSAQAFSEGFKAAPKGERFKGGFESIATFLKPEDTSSVVKEVDDKKALIDPMASGDIAKQPIAVAPVTAEAIDLSPAPIVDATTDVIGTGTDTSTGEVGRAITTDARTGFLTEAAADITDVTAGAFGGTVLDFNIDPQIIAARKLREQLEQSNPQKFAQAISPKN